MGINHVKIKYQLGSSRINEKDEKQQFQSQRIKLESIEDKRYFKMRRSFLSQVINFSIGIFAPTEDSNGFLLPLCRARKKQDLLKLGKNLGKDSFLKRFQGARKTLQHMLVDCNNISKGGSDNVRRYLRTVGVASSMYGITKVFKELQEQSDDLVEYTKIIH